MRICLIETNAESFDPLTLTRPLFDLRCGLLTLGEKQRRTLRASAWSVWVRPELEDLVRQQMPNIPVNDLSWLQQGPTILVNARWLPAKGCCLPSQFASKGMLGTEIAWAALTAEQLAGLEASDILHIMNQDMPDLSSQTTAGVLLRYPWDLVDHNSEEITRDVDEGPSLPMSKHGSLLVVGPTDRVFVHPTARLDPLVVIDTTPGPVVIQEKAIVTAFTRLEGPCVIGAGSQLMGAKIRGGVTLGPQCRIGGEVETSIIHGYSNKYHEGFLGHSYVGEWVNLGAGTHASDLRNDYGEVEVTIAGRRIATGRTKIGCYLGDHTKTGLGSLINTGTNIGVFSNILPAGRLAPKYIPSYTTWWNGALRLGFPMPQLLITARTVMERRGQTLTPAHIRLFEYLWEATDNDRCRVLRESEQKSLRRTA